MTSHYKQCLEQELWAWRYETFGIKVDVSNPTLTEKDGEAFWVSWTPDLADISHDRSWRRGIWHGGKTEALERVRQLYIDGKNCYPSPYLGV